LLMRSSLILGMFMICEADEGGAGGSLRG
jgi:hypothetical protein